MRRTFILIVVAILFLLFTTACGGAASNQPDAPARSDAPALPADSGGADSTGSDAGAPDQEPPATAQGSLTMALSLVPNAIDVARASDQATLNVAWQLYDSLVWQDNAGQITPALAEDWEISADNREYIFRLRQDVTFHNGEPFNAAAVVASWERGRQDDMAWSDRWAAADTVQVVDDFTVKVTTPEPNALLLRTMANFWAMTPPQYLAEVGEQGFADQPVGTGPFMLAEWVKGDRVVMEANPNYWRPGFPRLQEVIFRPIPESSTRVAAIQTGEVDIATRLSAEEAQTLRDRPNVEVLEYPVDRVFYITFNNLTSGVGQPTEDKRVRQAMNYAVDVQSILDALFDGYGRPSTGFVIPSNLGYDAAITPFGYDPDRARQLLAEAGYPDGFSIDMACPGNAQINFDQVCEAIQGYLGEVGITVNLELMESGQFWELEAQKQPPPLFGDSWTETSGEALPRLEGALRGWDASFSAWSDPEIDRLLDAISTTIDDEARAALYVELQRYMQEDPPFIYLYELSTFEGVNPSIRDYRPRAAESFFLMETWIAGN